MAAFQLNNKYYDPSLEQLGDGLTPATAYGLAGGKWRTNLYRLFTDLLAQIAALGVGTINASNIFGHETVSSALTITLTNSSKRNGDVSMTAGGQAVRAPDATTIVKGEIWRRRNSGANAWALQNNSGGVLVASVAPGDEVEFWCEVNGTAAGTWRTNALTANGRTALAGFTSVGSGVATAADAAAARVALGLNDILQAAGPQLLDNGDFAISQAGTSFTSAAGAANQPVNNDNVVLIDRWRLLSDTNTIVNVDQVLDSGEYALKAVVATANKRFGFSQILRSRDVRRAFDNAGGVVSLSFEARTTTAKVINKVRALVLAWSGTADAPTRDVVSAWGSQGANPTMVASWTIEGSAELALTTSWQRFELENVPLDTASTANLAVFILTDDTDAAVNDELLLRRVKLEPGPVATAFVARPESIERDACELHRRVIKAGSANNMLISGKCSTTARFHGMLSLGRPMWAVPSAVVSGAADGRLNYLNETAVNTTTITPGHLNPASIRIEADVSGTPLTAGQGAEFGLQSTTANIRLEAEI